VASTAGSVQVTSASVFGEIIERKYPLESGDAHLSLDPVVPVPISKAPVMFPFPTICIPDGAVIETNPPVDMFTEDKPYRSAKPLSA
jgi:hypothetical protein